MRIVTLGRRDYVEVWRAMQAFTRARDAATADELWLVEHPPVYTLGLAGRAHQVHDAAGVPVVSTDRGGQVTYHGPGQVVAYPLVDLRRLGFYVKEYVYRLERATIDVLLDYGLTGHRVAGAPGVYVRLDDPSGHSRHGAAGSDERFDAMGKIAALGIKVTNHASYHGLALNVAMDLQPFMRIDPCGYAGLRTVDLATLGVHTTWDAVGKRLAERLAALLVR